MVGWTRFLENGILRRSIELFFFFPRIIIISRFCATHYLNFVKLHRGYVWWVEITRVEGWCFKTFVEEKRLMQNRNESLDNWFFSFRSTNNIKKNKDSNTDSRDFISFSRIFNLSRERKSSVSVDKQSTVPSKRLHGNNLKFFYSRIEKLGKQIVYLQYTMIREENIFILGISHMRKWIIPCRSRI